MVSKLELLRELNIGARVAEDEADELSRYFVETDQWRRLIGGEVDIVFGPKGSGKSAIYSSMLPLDIVIAGRPVVLVAGENPRGTPAFADLVTAPPTSEPEFVALWKLYLVSLLSKVLSDFGIEGEDVDSVHRHLADVGLEPRPGEGLRGLVQRVREYLRRVADSKEIETGLRVDPTTGVPIGVTAKITLAEPTDAERRAGQVSIDELLRLCDDALTAADIVVWIVFDRLDVAFADSRELEANALRALFKVYLDMLEFKAISLKIFLRTDIWSAITRGGFREASHITRTVTIRWTDDALLNLVVRRLLQNPAVVEAYSAVPSETEADARAQRQFFDRLVPDQIDSGRNPKTFEWILGRVVDGSKNAAPREVIHLLTQAREVQIAMLERGENEPENGALFVRQAFRDALPEVSDVRLKQTLYAEYPDLREYLERLERERTNHSVETLGRIWRTDTEQTRAIAEKLVEIGFFERRGTKEDPDYWVPFLYRPALNLVQGSAE